MKNRKVYTSKRIIFLEFTASVSDSSNAFTSEKSPTTSVTHHGLT